MFKSFGVGGVSNVQNLNSLDVSICPVNSSRDTDGLAQIQMDNRST